MSPGPGTRPGAGTSTVDTEWVDFPTLGFNKDWIVVQGTVVSIPFHLSTRIWVFGKADLYAGGSGSFTSIAGETDTIGGIPAVTLDPDLSALYLVQNWNGDADGNGVLRLYTITGPIGSEVLTPVAFVATPNPWSNEAGGNGNFCPQMGHPVKINCGGAIEVLFRNGTIWATHAIYLPADSPTRSAIQWWQLAPDGGVVQRGRLDDASGVRFYGFPSIAVNRSGDVLLGFASFSAQQFASGSYAYRAAGDPYGTLRAEHVLKAGEDSYLRDEDHGRNRWGDYSATVVDPGNDIDFWTIQEYAATRTPSAGYTVGARGGAASAWPRSSRGSDAASTSRAATGDHPRAASTRAVNASRGQRVARGQTRCRWWKRAKVLRDRFGLSWLLWPLCLCLLATRVLAGESKLDMGIFAGKETGEAASFLVVMREQADLAGAEHFTSKEDRGRFVYEALREHAEATQASLRERLRLAGVPFRPFFVVNIVEVEADRALATELALREDVFAVAANRLAPTSAEPLLRLAKDAASRAGVEPNIERIRAPELWASGFRGQGIVVAVADTGLTWDHPALRDRYRGFDGSSVSHDYNWHDAIHATDPGDPCGADSAAPCDDDGFGHGTACAGIIAGNDGENQVGVAPEARLIACRNMALGVGSPRLLHRVFQFFLAPTDGAGENPRPDLAPDVINNSWTCPVSEGCTDPNILRAVIENTRAAGIFVAMAAGNEGDACFTVNVLPAFYEASFSVGATTIDDAIATFSSRGPVLVDGSGRLKPDLVAPGVGVRTTASPSGYVSFDGTSAAAPHVAGAAALLYSAAPNLRGRPVETADMLRRSAEPLTTTQDCGGVAGGSVPNAVFGFGRLDVAAAAALAASVAPVARMTPRPLAPHRTPLALPPRGQ